MKRVQYMTDDEFEAFLTCLDNTSAASARAMVGYILEGDTAEDVRRLREHGHEVEDYPGSTGIHVCNPDARRS